MTNFSFILLNLRKSLSNFSSILYGLGEDSHQTLFYFDFIQDSLMFRLGWQGLSKVFIYLVSTRKLEWPRMTNNKECCWDCDDNYTFRQYHGVMLTRHISLKTSYLLTHFVSHHHIFIFTMLMDINYFSVNTGCPKVFF